MLESILEMNMRCDPYWSTVSTVRAKPAHARRYTAMCAVRAKRARAGAGVGRWGVGLLQQIPCNFLAASPALHTHTHATQSDK